MMQGLFILKRYLAINVPSEARADAVPFSGYPPEGAWLAATRLASACQEMKTPQCLNDTIRAIAGLVICLVTQLSPFC